MLDGGGIFAGDLAQPANELGDDLEAAAVGRELVVGGADSRVEANELEQAADLRRVELTDALKHLGERFARTRHGATARDRL